MHDRNNINITAVKTLPTLHFVAKRGSKVTFTTRSNKLLLRSSETRIYSKEPLLDTLITPDQTLILKIPDMHALKDQSLHTQADTSSTSIRSATKLTRKKTYPCTLFENKQKGRVFVNVEHFSKISISSSSSTKLS